MPILMAQRPLDNARPSASDDPLISARAPIGRAITIGTGVLLMFYLFGMVFIGDDLVAIALMRLGHLGISYPPILRHASVIAPPACAALWLGLAFCVSRCKWRWRAVFAIVSAVLVFWLCVTVIGFVPRYAESRVRRVPIVRELTQAQSRLLKSRVSFPILETADWRGREIWIANREDCAERLKQELRELGLLARQNQSAASRAGNAQSGPSTTQ
jgi:hypothetical protein